MSASQHTVPLFGENIAILTATSRDAALARDTLNTAGWSGQIVGAPTMLRPVLNDGCGALLLAEEACTRPVLEELSLFLEEQPAWSDLPILFLLPTPKPSTPHNEGNDGFERLAKWIPRGNISFLERPLRRSTLIAAMEFALRARARQYAQRDLIREKEREVIRRDEFLAMLGHELRNPLAAIRYAVELLDLLDEADETRSPREVIARQTRTLGRLVDDLLDVARVTRGKIALDLQPLNLNEIVQKTLASLEAAHKGDEHHIEFSPESHAVHVTGDPVRLEQIFSNLLYNAIKYTPRGGHIQINLWAENDTAIATIADNGIGMDARLLPRVFELFSQSEQAIDRARGGLGIGLTLVHGLVELHRGQITAHSPGVGQGSKFEVRLPLIQKKTPSTNAPSKTDAIQPRRVVVIEDNDDARELVCLLLKRDGHHVEWASDGHRGLKLLTQSPPDVAFVDIGLPEMDGYEVAQHVREALGPAIRLVAVTGYGQPEDADRAIQSGFNAHLTKPISLAALRGALADISK
ncbi:autoinducer 2 sensor kinase/phosphatase LuxQ [Abditibacteriota bacterium]|nr:autoinducer 2 sensor kinase/phosphatase LuxQ [Abditibacteriota bacterium]